MHHRTLHRALLLGALAAGAWTATELADDTAAHADTQPPAVTIERPGGLLDRAAKLPPRLPQQASARARAAVAKATAEPTPSTPTEPLPAPVELPPALPPIEVPPLTDPAPIPTPVPVPVPTPPVVDVPDPLPTNDGTDPQLPLPVPAPVVLPELLPVAIGPVPGAEPPAVEAPTMLGHATTVVDVEVEWCPDEMRTDYAPDDRDMIGQLIASLTDGAEAPRAQSAPGCPGTPDRDATPGTVQVKPPTQSAADTAVSSVTGSHVPPVLARLEHTRARSHLPAGRSQHIEPSPA